MKSNIVYLPIDKLSPHPNNPRVDLGDLSELAASIEAQGILQNLTVVPAGEDAYTVVIGHRRLAAAKLAGLTEVPCSIADMDIKEQVGTMLLENMQRQDLTYVEQADGIQMMMDLGASPKDIAEKTGLSRTTVMRRVNMAKLDRERVLAAQERGATLMDFAKLEKITDIEQRNMLLDWIGEGNFNWEVKQAFDMQERPKRQAELLEQLRTFAEQVDSWDDLEGHYETVEYFRDGKAPGYWKKPDDAEEVKYYFSIFEKWLVCLVREGGKESDEDKLEREKRKKFNRRIDRLDQLHARMYDRRKSFIVEFDDARQHAEEIYKAVGRRLTDTSYLSRSLVIELLGGDDTVARDYSEKSEYMRELADQALDKDLEHTMLILAYATYDDNKRKGYSIARDWMEEIAYTESEQMDALYAMLQSFGYQLNQEEKELKDGTHEIYDPEGAGQEKEIDDV